LSNSRPIDAEGIYLRLPIPLQHLSCSVVGWRTERTRYAGAFPHLLEAAQGRTYSSVDQIRAFRDDRLAQFVRSAAQNIPFYRDRLGREGLDPERIRSLEDLASLPVLSKAEAQEQMRELRSSAAARRGTIIAHTSGTTGGALRFAVTLHARQEQWATWWRYRAWHGIERGTWCGLFAGRSVVPSSQTTPPFWRMNYPGRQVLFSGYHLSPQNLPHYVAQLRRRRLPWLHGYPSLLALIAAHLLETGSDLGYPVRWVTTGAENLLPHQAAAIERALGVRPRQHYGLAEGVANVSECELGRLHVDEDYAAVEFVPLGSAGLHRIVGTNFTNAATPLLRYDTQDVAVVTGDSCSCARPGRVVERIDGRLEDYVVLRNGVRIGRMDHIFKDMINVKEAQIHQQCAGKMTIRIVRNRGYSEVDDRALLEETKRRVGDEMEVAIEYVEALPRTDTGKLRFVVSQIPEASIERPATAAEAS
jgi:phenylacetate-CoA ligase